MRSSSLSLALLFSSVPLVAATVAPVGINGYYATDSTAAFTTIVGAGGTLIPGTSVDDAVSTFTLPFGLTFYGVPFAAGTSVSVSSNGNLQFIGAGASDDFVNVTLSQNLGTVAIPSFPTRSIFPYWDDLILTTPGGGVYQGTLGSPGTRQLVVEWVGRRIGDGAVTTNTRFQAVFFENSTDFVFHYGSTGIGGTANGASATVGSWDSLGNYTQWSHNSGVITPNLLLRFSQTDPSPVPEPGTLGMVTLAAAGAALLRSRRRR